MDHAVRSVKQTSVALDSQLKLYVLSAGAVSVSLMALAQPAAADIVYTQVHHVIPISPDFQYIDINGDGVPDFAFLHYTYGLSYSQNSVISIDAHKHAVVGIEEICRTALRRRRHRRIRRFQRWSALDGP